MYSRPAAISTGTMWPGSFVANASSPAAPMARYSVMKMEPPPATRLSTPNKPPPPPNCVCVVIWMELLIQESSPASEMMASFGSRMNSSTGMVVPVMRLCIVCSPKLFDIPSREWEKRKYTTEFSRLRAMMCWLFECLQSTLLVDQEVKIPTLSPQNRGDKSGAPFLSDRRAGQGAPWSSPPELTSEHLDQVPTLAGSWGRPARSRPGS